MSNDKKPRDQFKIDFDELEEDEFGSGLEPDDVQPVQMVDFDDELDSDAPKTSDRVPTFNVFEPEEEPETEPIRRDTVKDDSKKRASYESGEEEDDEDVDSFEPEPERVRKPVKKADKRNSFKKESIRFLIFTVIIALLAVGAIIFILVSRGIFDSDKKPSESAKPSETLPVIESSSETEPVTETEEPTTETEEPTTESETPTVKEITPESVLDNYNDVFIVNTELLRVREQPSTSANIVATMLQNTGGDVLEDNGAWLKIKSGTIVGYVSSSFVLRGDAAKSLAVAYAREYVTVTGVSVNVRRGPGMDYEVIDTVPTGMLFNYEGEEGNFYKISCEAYNGYISKDYSKRAYFLDGAVPVAN